MYDLISDMLIRIKNGYNSKQALVLVKYSKVCFNILFILYKEGVINGFSITKDGFILVKLKYYRNDYLFKNYFRLSKPGRRIYVTAKQLKSYFNKKSIVILSTNQGILIHKHALSLNLGGEILFELSY